MAAVAAVTVFRIEAEHIRDSQQGLDFLGSTKADASYPTRSVPLPPSACSFSGRFSSLLAILRHRLPVNSARKPGDPFSTVFVLHHASTSSRHPVHGQS